MNEDTQKVSASRTPPTRVLVRFRPAGIGVNAGDALHATVAGSVWASVFADLSECAQRILDGEDIRLVVKSPEFVRAVEKRLSVQYHLIGERNGITVGVFDVSRNRVVTLEVRRARRAWFKRERVLELLIGEYAAHPRPEGGAWMQV